MIRSDEALEFHAGDRPGKLEVRPAKPCLTARDMRLAYLPGARFACKAIAACPEDAFRFTARGNLVGVVTNGSSVPGLGDIGPVAAKPMGEGLALLFKRLADIDAFDIELDTHDADALIEAIRLVKPTFGAVVLKDLRAPEGLYVHERLSETLGIPVFHENLQSTAVVATAALMNALALAEKDVTRAQIVISGAGTVGIGCARLFRAIGVRPENLRLYDVHGLLHADRDDLNAYQRAFARPDGPGALADALRGADVFVGASVGRLLTPEMVRSMARFPVVFALATPDPEIGYEEARACRHDVIVATSLTQLPNAVVDFLSFPYVLRGALDVHATRITDGMLLAAARALADLGREEVVEEVSRAYGGTPLSFGPEYVLPRPIDPRILVRESAAVARCAVEEGVARKELEAGTYQESLAVRFGTGREILRRLLLAARQECPRVVFAEGTNETVLRAASILLEEGVARPILLGTEAEVRAEVERLGLDAAGVTIVDPARTPRREAYLDEYLKLRRRRGVMRTTARDRLRRADRFAALMLRSGDADLMVSGITAHYADSIRTILEVIGTAPGIRRISSHYMVLLPRDVFFFADCGVNVDPDAEELAEIALLTAGCARAAGIEPRVAMLSFSNFGSVEHPLTRKVRRATEIVKARAPGLVVDGEMQLATALSAEIRGQNFPFTDLTKDANVLIFPDLQAGNLATQLLERTGGAVTVGPVLMGTARPVHLVQYGSSVPEIVNLVVAGIVQASAVAVPS
jgi:malate dehydrogenase (oxaloacetate-decarboxylating)(NADP+)